MKTVAPPPENAPALDGHSSGHLDRFKALCRLVQRGQGKFALALVEFNLPRVRRSVLDELRQRFDELNIVTVELTPPPPDAPPTLNVLDQLTELAEIASPDRPPDLLIITGYESLFPDATTGESAAREQLARVIQPLNLGRNVLAQTFPCPVLLGLPSSAMVTFLRSAPDLNSWRSGYFQFEVDVDEVRRELESETAIGTGWMARWQLRRQTPQKLLAEVQRVEALIADALAVPSAATTMARLQNRLGWVAVALGDRARARRAFAEMLRLAREANDTKLSQAAERGRRAAEQITIDTPHTTLAPHQIAAARDVFRGAAALTESEGLYGRDEELGRLLGQVMSVECRFLIVWGETGCGKSSLVLAGLVPELQRLGRYLPAIVRQWNEPEADICHALAQAAGLELDAAASLHDNVRDVARQTGQVVVIVCDQFEQFFTLSTQRSNREPLLHAIGDCLKDYGVECKFVFVLREDEMGRMAEFDAYVPEPLEQRKRFYLPLFNAENALRVLQQMAQEAGLSWPDSFMRRVVADLTRDGRVRPIELQLVGAALAASGINDELAYARGGGAPGLLTEYLELVLRGIFDFSKLLEVAMQQRSLHGYILRLLRILPPFSRYIDLIEKYWEFSLRKNLVVMAKRLLLVLVADPVGRLALAPAEIARRAGTGAVFTAKTLDLLAQSHIVRHLDTPPPDGRYELVHDKLAELVLLVTRDLQDQHRQANRVLRRALEDTTVNPRHTIGLRDWSLVRKYADEEEVAGQRAHSLLGRSLLWGGFKWFVLPPVLLVFILTVVQLSSGYVSFEQDFADRVVVRRGIRWLGFLPVIGNAPVLDTGFVEDDFVRTKRDKIGRLTAWDWRWSNQQSGLLDRETFVQNIEFPVQRGTLWFQIGYPDKGIEDLLSGLQDNDKASDPGGSVRAAAATALGQVAQAKPELAAQIFNPLLNTIRYAHNDTNIDPDGSVSDAAEAALGQVAQAAPELVLNPLLSALKDKHKDTDTDHFVRTAAATALGQVAQAKPELAAQIFNPLLNALKDKDGSVYAAAAALGQVAQAKPKLASQILNPLLSALKDKASDPTGSVREAAAAALGQVAQAAPELVLNPLLNALQDNDKASDPGGSVRGVAATALGQVAQAKPELATQILNPLLSALKDKDGSVYAAAAALGQVAQAKPELAAQVLNSLLNAFNDKDSDPGGSVRGVAATALGQVAQAKPELAAQILKPLLNALKDTDKDPYSLVRNAAATALRQVAQAAPELAFNPLLNALQDTDTDTDTSVIVRAAAAALGQVAQAKPELASQILNPLLNTIKDKNPDGSVRGAAATALGQVAQAKPELATQIFNPLLNALKDKDISVREAAAALVQVAQANQSTQVKIFSLLTDYNSDVRDGLRDSLSVVLVDLATKEQEPTQFLLDHLEGQKSLLPQGDANTYAIYRKVVVGATAQWLVQDTANNPKAKAQQATLRKTLEEMRDSDTRLHLRIAAWDALAQAADLKAKKRNGDAEDK